MNLLHGLKLSPTEPFTHNGKNYEIRVISDGYNMVVKSLNETTRRMPFPIV